MKRKKTNLMYEKNLKKKIVVIGAVFFIISVGLNSILGHFFSQKTLPENPKKEDVIQIPDEEQSIPITDKKVEEILTKSDISMINRLSFYIDGIIKHGPHTTATIFLKWLSKVLGEKFNLPIENVAGFIQKQLNNMGLKVEVQDWKQKINIRNLLTPKVLPGFYCGKNIWATLPGTNESSDEIYILVAHYDTWYRSNGADACTSGVAAVLTIAELMSEYTFENTVRFLFVDGEFQGSLGSQEYVKMTKDNNENIVATFFIDSIGNPGFDYNKDNVVISLKKTCWVSDYIEDVNCRYQKFLNFNLNNDCSRTHNHHDPFLDYGYDAVCFCEADFDKIPTSSDTYENIDFNYAKDITQLIVANICELALGLNK